MENLLTSRQILTLLQQQKTYLQEKFRVSKIGLFGSFARDEATDKSDLDFLVEFEEGVINIFDIKYELREYLEKLFGKKVDLVRHRALKPYFKERILKQAIYA